LLSQVLRQLPKITDSNLLIGPKTSDDAAVYKLSEELAIIQTVDFFPPMTDDPYLYGQIAAANSLSDIYAMGGKPILALNIVCFPSCLPIEMLEKILLGGASKVNEAGAVIAGGHSIVDDTPKYGLAVTGIGHPDKILSNSKACPGDLLILTKPLGTGIINIAVRGQLASEESIQAAMKSMLELNRQAAEIMLAYPVNACTDITGFGLLGHALELALASGVSLEIGLGKIPLLPGVEELASMGMIPAGAYQNRDYLKDKIDFSEKISTESRAILFDPQTSGGLLISAPPASARSMLDKMLESSIDASIIGQVKENAKYPIKVFQEE
jgi:selenide,water dikinase